LRRPAVSLALRPRAQLDLNAVFDPVGKPAADFASHPGQQQKEYGDVIRQAHIEAE
jgi:hypothetical protein